MKEYDKLTWLEDLAVKYELPVEQVMIAYATYQVSCNLSGCCYCNLEFSDVVLAQVFGVDGL